MAITLGSAYGKVELDASGVTRGAQAAAAAMGGVSKAGRDLSASFSLVSRDARAFESSMQPVGLALTGIAGGLTLVGAKSVKTAGDFQSSMNMFQAVASASSEEMGRVSKTAKDLGADMELPATSALNAGQAMTELAKAGLNVRDTMNAAKGTLQLATAGNLSEAASAKIAANALNAFHLEGREATRVADLLAAASNASSAEVTDVADSMQMAAAVFASSHVPIEDLVTAIGEMANAGIQGSDAGTSLKQMLLSLQAPTAKARGLMDELGIQIYDAQGKMLPFRDIIGNISTALGGLTQEQRNQALATIFGSDAVRAANVVLMGGVSAFDQMKEAVTREGAAAELAGSRMKGLNGAMENVKSQAETAALAMGEALAPAVEGVARNIGDLIAGFNEMSPAAQSATAGALAVTAAVTGATGAFILLAPKIVAGAQAMVTFVAFGKDVVAGLQLMRAGFTAAEVASTGFAGSVAVALPVVLALTAALIAAYKAYELNQQIQKDTAKVGEVFAKHLMDQVAAGKSATEIMDEYAATQERINRAYEAAPAYVKPFIDQQKLLTSGSKEYIEILSRTNVEQADYEAEARKAAAALGLQIDAEGNLGRLVKENGKLRFEVTQAQFMLTAAEREGAKAVNEVTDEYARQQNALDGLAETARGVAAAREKSVAQMKQETEASNELRDSQAALTDQALSMAETFAQSNEKMGERAGLEAQLSKLDAEIAKQGAAHVEVIKKRTMSEQELRASTSELVNLERQLWDIHRKKGETDEALNARMDATKLKYDELKIKIDQATGAVGAHTGIVGGATAAQEKERQAILDKMSAIDEEIKKELARQAVESLTPEMFGTGAAAAEKYAEAKRQLMLATGLVTSESLAEQDSIKILTAALAAGQIAPDQYATALGRVKQAAEDGKVSLGELMSSPFLAGGSKFALKNADEIGRSISAPIAAAKTQMQAAGADLASGVSAGIQSQAGAMGTALTGSVDAGVAQLKAAYQMESPSLVMAGYGSDLMAGMAQGATAGAEILGAALSASVTTALVPMMETITLLSGTMNILNVSFANATLALAPVTAAITATALQADFLSLSLTNASITLSGPMSVSVVTLTGQTDLLNLSLTNVSNTLTVSLGLALATTTVALDVLNTAFTTVKNTLEFELNRVLGGPQGTIEDLITVGQLAGKSMGSIAEPLQAAFFVLRDAAAEAGSAVGGVAAGLADIKAMNGLVTHVWVYTHEVTIHEPDQTSGGGSSNPEPVSGEYQVGGIVPRTQLARVDAGEAILTPDMRRGLEPIPAGWLMPAAMERALGTAAARAAEGAAGSPGRNSGTVNHLSVYGGLALYGVQDTRSLLRELMP